MNPARLRFVNAKTASERQQIKYLRSDCDLMLELRQMIFNSCKGECLSRDRSWKKFIQKARRDALTTARLAHIVSCPECLDAVNSLLGLAAAGPTLHSGRYRSMKNHRRDANGGGASGGGSGDLTQEVWTAPARNSRAQTSGACESQSMVFS